MRKIVLFIRKVASSTALKTQEPNSRLALFAEIKECTKTRNLERGKRIHAAAIEHDSSIYVINALIHMYAKCGSMVDARQIFERLKHPNVISWNALILGYAVNGEGLTALDLFSKMSHEGPSPDSRTHVAALKACTSLVLKEESNGQEECRRRNKYIHELVVKNGFDSNIFVQNTLIDMYTKSGSMADARKVFDSTKYPDVISWNVLILGYAENGQGLTALDLFMRMKAEGHKPDYLTFVAALKACTSLAFEVGAGRWSECRKWGKMLHTLAVEHCFDSNLYVQNALIDMYTKCGNMSQAQEIFDKMKNPDVVIWTSLILGYADNGQSLTALRLFTRMENVGPSPNSVTLLAGIKACTLLAVKEGCAWEECMKRGKKIHDLAVQCGCYSDICLQNTLMNMYCKCGSMLDAHQVFDSIENPNVVSWTTVILGYADNGQGYIALDMFTKMKTQGPKPDSVTLSAALKACGMVGGLEYGRRIHSEINKGNHLDLVLVNGLIDFYAKCGSLDEAQRVFVLHANTRNTITWTSLLSGFSSSGDEESVFSLFEEMQDAGFQPDCITFLCVLACCSHSGLVEKGKECFDSMPTRHGLVPAVEHYTCMLDIFCRSKKLDEAMALLQRMNWKPNEISWMTILNACREWKNVEIGRLAFQCLVHFSDRDAAAYVIMGQIYGSRGMLQEQTMLMNMKRGLNIRKMPATTCWTNHLGETNTFFVE